LKTNLKKNIERINKWNRNAELMNNKKKKKILSLYKISLSMNKSLVKFFGIDVYEICYYTSSSCTAIQNGHNARGLS